jgi:hypothetical protein
LPTLNAKDSLSLPSVAFFLDLQYFDTCPFFLQYSQVLVSLLEVIAVFYFLLGVLGLCFSSDRVRFYFRT